MTVATITQPGGSGTNGQGQTDAQAHAVGNNYGIGAPAPEPTVNDLYGSEADQAGRDKVAAYDPASIAATEGQTRSDVLGAYQGQLDGLDRAAAEARARISTTFAPTAADRLGSSTALQARRGLSGSSFGAAMTDKVNSQNSTDLNSLISGSDSTFAKQKSDLLQFIQGEADKESQTRIDATQKGADAKIQEINDRQARATTSAQASVKAMIASGVTDPTNPNYNDGINTISSNTGLTKDQVASLFTDAKNSADQATAAKAKADADAAAAGRTTLSPGQTVIGPDGKTILSLPPKDTYQVVKGATTTDALGNSSTAPDRVFDATTGQFVGTVATGGGSAAPAAPAAPTGPAPVTLPAPTTPAAPPVSTTDTIFGKNNDSAYANGTVEDALGKLGVSANAATKAGVDPKAKVSDLPDDQRKALGEVIDQNGGIPKGDAGAGAAATANDNPNAPFAQYGLLTKTDFNPKQPIDTLAAAYLDKYIKNGTVPTASTLGRGIKPAGFAQVEARAQDLFFKATGNPLPTPQIIKQQQELIASNNKLGNNLKIQEGTVRANVDLSIANLKKNNLNSTGFAPLNGLINTVDAMFQDPNVGQLLAQNSTIQNELGSLLAVKNAGGTTVYDKLTSAGIISSTDDDKMVSSKVNALLKEAKNFADQLTDANADAYKLTDPLLQDSNNPARADYLNGGKPTSSTTADSGNGGGSAVTAPDGSQVIITD